MAERKKPAPKQKSQPKPHGRPTLYTPELVDQICERIALGESLRMICRDEAMPDRITVTRWIVKHEDFATRYGIARELQAEYHADEMIDIADDGSNDWMEIHDREGSCVGYKVNGEAVARSKIRLEQRRWYAEKLLPKKYGRRLELAGDPTAPVRFMIDGLEPSGK